VDRAEAVDDLRGLVEALAGDAVRPLVLAEVDVALVVELLRQLLYRAVWRSSVVRMKSS